MKKKILMINPPTGLFIRDDRCQSNVENFLVSINRPPHELLIMATVLKNHGYEVLIRDYPVEKKSIADYKYDVQKFLPDVVVINGTIPTINDDISYSLIAKKIKRDLIVIFRCGAIEYIAEEIMGQEESIDAVFYGESDFTLYEFLERDDKINIRGIFYRDKGKIIKTQERPFISDMDSIPLVDRDLIRNELYKRPDTGSSLGLVEVSRGGPHSCIFCLAPFSYGKHHRKRCIENILKEIRICTNDYKIFDFHFKSDLFSFDRKWVVKLCQAIINNGLKIRWFANSRVDTIDEELLEIMKESGCFALALGVESGSQHILNKIKKNISIKDIEKAFDLCKKHQIQTYSYFIIGFPWDTEDTIKETISFSIKIDPDYVDFFFPYVFKETELFRIMEEQGFVVKSGSKDIVQKSYIGLQFPTVSLDRERLIKLRKKALRGFYLRPAYFFKTLKRCNSFKERLYLLGHGISSLKKILG